MVDTSDLLDSSGQCNARRIVCPLCRSAILPAMKGHYREFDYELFARAQKGQQEPVDKETVRQFYLVEDMFDFDNIGVSKAVGDVSHSHAF